MQPGAIVGDRYQIIKELGKGGGGIVYLANHLTLKQQVVLKQIKYADTYTEQEALRNEVDILKRLKHPALPQVYDFLQIDGLVFTAMEYIPGYSLGEYMKSGTRFPQEKILMWARQLAEILDYMHTRKQPVIHRDIKPSNIMLKPDWNVSLIDFNVSDNSATSCGVTGYSRDFASPEQLEKGRLMEHRIPSGHIVIDARSDIYSLGAVLYYLLCGEKPGDPYISLESRNCCMYPLAKIVDKCLRKEKKERYQTAAELNRDLNHLERTDKEYLKYAWLQRISIMMSIFLMTAGICLIRFGREVIIKNSFLEAYDEFVQSVENQDPDVGRKIEQILRNPEWTRYVEGDEERAENLYLQQGRYYSGFNYDNAHKAYDKALHINPKNERTYKDYLDCCLRFDHPDMARVVIKKAKEAGVSDIDLKLYEGKVFLQDGDFASAINVLTEIIDGHYGAGIQEEAKTCYAAACIELRDYDRAVEMLNTKEVLTATDYMNLALIFNERGKTELCREALLQASLLEPDNPEIYVRLAFLCLGNNEVEQARRYYDLAKDCKKTDGSKLYSEEFEEDFQELDSLLK